MKTVSDEALNLLAPIDADDMSDEQARIAHAEEEAMRPDRWESLHRGRLAWEALGDLLIEQAQASDDAEGRLTAEVTNFQNL